jgi:hypothetical protein
MLTDLYTSSRGHSSIPGMNFDGTGLIQFILAGLAKQATCLLNQINNEGATYG